MYCKNCGKKLEDSKSFCGNCGTKQEVEEIIEVKVENDPTKKDENHLANVLCTISLCLYFGGSTVIGILIGILSAAPLITGPLMSLLSIASGLCPIAAYVLMIIARVKCPKSTYAKVVMWIYIALFILSIIVFLIMLVACTGLLVSCANYYN